MNQGWTCPKCSKVYAPTVSECHTCNAGVAKPILPTYPPTSPTIPDPIWPSKERWWEAPWIVTSSSKPNDSGTGWYIGT